MPSSTPKNPRGRQIDSQYQPSKAELEADMSIPTTPDELLRAVINHKPSKSD